MIATHFNLDSVEVIQASITRIKTASDLAFDKGAKLEFGNLNHIKVAQTSALYAGGKEGVPYDGLRSLQHRLLVRSMHA